MGGFRYQYNCTSPVDLEELHYVLDNFDEITREEFVENVNNNDLRELEISLGYKDDFKMEDDPYVTYGEVTYKKQKIYFFSWSGIEFIFK